MNRIERSYLFHRLVSTINFSKTHARDRLSKGEIYELCDLLCDEICTKSIMVVSASSGAGMFDGLGVFGKDEPWPDWCNKDALERDFGEGAEQRPLNMPPTYG